MTMLNAKTAVNTAPGHTAHWYRQAGLFPKYRFNWVYRDFQTATRRGLIRAEQQGRYQTIYFPAED